MNNYIHLKKICTQAIIISYYHIISNEFYLRKKTYKLEEIYDFVLKKEKTRTSIYHLRCLSFKVQSETVTPSFLIKSTFHSKMLRPGLPLDLFRTSLPEVKGLNHLLNTLFLGFWCKTCIILWNSKFLNLFRYFYKFSQQIWTFNLWGCVLILSHWWANLVFNYLTW